MRLRDYKANRLTRTVKQQERIKNGICYFLKTMISREVQVLATRLSHEIVCILYLVIQKVMFFVTRDLQQHNINTTSMQN